MNGALTTGERAQVRALRILNGMPEAFKDEFVSSCTKRQYGPNEFVHRGDDDLHFMIMLNGCVVVSQGVGSAKTIDALITKGQLIGEFDFLGFRTIGFELTTLIETAVVLPDPDLLLRLKDSGNANEGELLSIQRAWYKNLSLTLMNKLRAQNQLLRFRSNQFEARLANLLDNFTSRDWRYMTNLAPEAPVSPYEIALFFTEGLLNGLVGGKKDGRSLRNNLVQLIRKNAVLLTKFDKKHECIGEAKSSEFANYKFPSCNYFKLTVLDHSEITQCSK